MDFGIGFLTNSVMLPFLDFLYDIVRNYGLAIVLLTVVIKGTLWPLTAGSIRSMRKMQVVQPEMQRQMKLIQEKHKDNPDRLRQETSGLYKEFGNPLAGCLPLLVQMPILFALFATLRGSPFADTVQITNVQIKPATELTEVKAEGVSPVYTIYLSEDSRLRQQVTVSPTSAQVPLGQTLQFKAQQVDGKPFTALKTRYEVVSGQDKARISATGLLETTQTGDATVHVTLPGIASEKGFLFIEQIGRSGVSGKDGIYWDNILLIVFFGVSIYFSQQLTTKNNPNINPQQAQINKITPFIFSGMFIFFPLPAGVLLYMAISNIFQIVQTVLLYREPLPENVQKLIDQQQKKTEGESALPFESKGRRKKRT
ncbi:MAG: membrane protein insertase YidC [Gemmatimonadaceae bacterium]|nr:membrane protein insertase YidC [Gloeobacterales cyanobacterium ES-bin-141]